MPIQTRNVTVTIYDSSGEPLENAKVDIRLVGLGNEPGGAVAPGTKTQYTDQYGETIFVLWENDQQYSDTYYEVNSWHPTSGIPIHRRNEFQVGNANADLEDLIAAGLASANPGSPGQTITNTDELAEGEDNLYFTEERALAATLSSFEAIDAVLNQLGNVANVTASADVLAMLNAATNAAIREAIGSGTGNGSVTSIGMTVPTGLEVSVPSITESGTFALSFASGYSIPTTTKQSQWDVAFANAGTALQPAAIGVSVAALVAGVVPAGQLPSYVDDVVSVANYAALPVTGESGKIYIVEAAGTHGGEPFPANSQFRWSGSVYVKLVASPGTTDNVTEGAANLYHTVARVRATALTGFAAAVGLNAVLATDSVLAAFQKIQGWLNGLGNLTTLTASANVLTMLGSADNAAIRTNIGAGTGNGSVTSIALAVPTGLSVTGAITTSGTITVSFSAGYSIPTTANQTNWTTAFTQTRQWDGGSTGLVAATGRASLLAAKKTALLTITTTTHNLDTANESAYHNFTNAGTKSVTVRPNSTHALETDGAWIITNDGAGDLTVIQGSGVNVKPRAGGTLVLAQNMSATIQKVGTDTYHLIGQTVPV